MNRGLRYANLNDLPQAMRARVELKQSTARRKQAAPRGPRRDEEHEQQVVFFNRIRALAINEPRFAQAARRTHAIPNGGGRSKREAGRLKAEGVVKGVPDIFCAMPQGSFHGLHIEMKSSKGRVSEEQETWLEESRELGYAGAVCRSADEAFEVWKAYVEGRVGEDA